MEFRKWQRQDFEKMIKLGEKMWKEGAYKNLTFSAEKLRKLGDSLIDKPDKGMGFVAIDNDEVIGMMIVYLRNYFFSDDVFCHDLMLFVDPYKRKSIKVPVRLINMATDWAREKGAKEFRPASSVGVEKEKVAKLYNFMKFENVGYVFRKEL
jgi:hypothetical protein